MCNAVLHLLAVQSEYADITSPPDPAPALQPWSPDTHVVSHSPLVECIHLPKTDLTFTQTDHVDLATSEFTVTSVTMAKEDLKEPITVNATLAFKNELGTTKSLTPLTQSLTSLQPLEKIDLSISELTKPQTKISFGIGHKVSKFACFKCDDNVNLITEKNGHEQSETLVSLGSSTETTIPVLQINGADHQRPITDQIPVEAAMDFCPQTLEITQPEQTSLDPHQHSCGLYLSEPYHSNDNTHNSLMSQPLLAVRDQGSDKTLNHLLEKSFSLTEDTPVLEPQLAVSTGNPSLIIHPCTFPPLNPGHACRDLHLETLPAVCSLKLSILTTAQSLRKFQTASIGHLEKCAHHN